MTVSPNKKLNKRINNEIYDKMIRVSEYAFPPIKIQILENWEWKSRITRSPHRGDGPARLKEDGSNWWCWCGVPYTFEKWCIVTEKTEEEVVQLKLAYDISKDGIAKFYENQRKRSR